MNEHPLELSERIIDSGVVDSRPNRITQELSELAEGVHLIESFSHVVLVDTGDGLVAFDSSGYHSGREVVASLRRWTDEPVHTIVYTHGHLDHVGGSRAFAADAVDRGVAAPRVVAHEAVTSRLERYQFTGGYNQLINLRQFGGAARSSVESAPKSFVPSGTLRPDVTYRDHFTETVGGTTLEHHHCRGETDDHTWTYLPEQRMIAAGDQFIWHFPNCGNPQKVQRYPLEWAESLRAMAATEVELFVPAHGLPIAGHERIVGCLLTVATTLEQLVHDVVDAMNSGAVLDDVLQNVSVADEVLSLPYLRPLYDEPEFVIRNIWRLYGGWWDGNPARLKPAPERAIGREVAGLAGGVEALIERAQHLSDLGDHRLACQLIEFAVAADPDHAAAHHARIDVYSARRKHETSLMSKGIFKSAIADSEARLTGGTPVVDLSFEIPEGSPND